MKRPEFLLSLIGAASAVAMQCFGFREKVKKLDPLKGVEFVLQQRMIPGAYIVTPYIEPYGSQMQYGKFVYRMAPVGEKGNPCSKECLLLYPEFDTPEEAEKHFQSFA